MLCPRGRGGTGRERMKTALCILKGNVLLAGLRSHDGGTGEEKSVEEGGERLASHISARSSEIKRDKAGSKNSRRPRKVVTSKS